MSTGQAAAVQAQLTDTWAATQHTVFTPPGIVVEKQRSHMLLAGVLASTRPLAHLSLHDHPASWRGLSIQSVLSMRRWLYRIVAPVDARHAEPSHLVEVLRTLALSVAPVALRVEVESLPPRGLFRVPGGLPAGPVVHAADIEVLSDPEVSSVAGRVTAEDIPATEGVWKLIEYDYTLDQVARFMALGMLGRTGSRRLMHMRAAYRASIDCYVTMAHRHLAQAPQTDHSTVHAGVVYGDTFIVVTMPGPVAVDYYRLHLEDGRWVQSASHESTRSGPADPLTVAYAGQARFAAYRHLVREGLAGRTVVLHVDNGHHGGVLGPWLARAGVMEAAGTCVLEVDDITGATDTVAAIAGIPPALIRGVVAASSPVR